MLSYDSYFVLEMCADVIGQSCQHLATPMA